MSTGDRSYAIAVVAHALDVLDALGEAAEPMGTSELARRLGMSKSGVFRILATLEARGYVAKDAATTRYTLGSRLALLGDRALQGLDLRRIARPELDRLHAAFGETVNLGVLDAGEIVYIDMVESTHGLRMAARIGSRHPAHATALGKAMLAFLPEPDLASALNAPLAAQTDRTITGAAALRRELDRVRQTGSAEETGENEPGARCVGVAIFDRRGLPTAALSVAGPESRIDDARAGAIAAALSQSARTITTAIGGRWPITPEDD